MHQSNRRVWANLYSITAIKICYQTGAESAQLEGGLVARLVGLRQGPAALGEGRSDFGDHIRGIDTAHGDRGLGARVDGGDQGIGQVLDADGTGGGGLLGSGADVVAGLVLLGGDVAHDDLSNRLVKN